MQPTANVHTSTGRPWARVFALLITIAVVLAWVWIEATPPERVAPSPARAFRIDKSTPAQAQRKAVIDKLLADGLLRRIDSDIAGGSEVRASVRPGFYKLDEAARREYAHVIYGFYFDGSNMNDVVVMRDGRNGNEVGRYEPYRHGLRMSK